MAYTLFCHIIYFLESDPHQIGQRSCFPIDLKNTIRTQFLTGAWEANDKLSIRVICVIHKNTFVFFDDTVRNT